ncbi:ethylene-responsive transcription factor ERF027 [Cajanus cajan]|uniref:ethylene-responsive transcription factor ERF027 n=1 Tax=Cajanus cajan TaxID=3821 RepID=UPI00098D86F6|nr:ethylene-responsive transcription factor ERF027 [Cajanus cajan]
MAPSASSKRHPLYHGIRCRGTKWVSRIWLGTFPTPEMRAAAAYDVASLALKGDGAVLNLPHSVDKYQIPATNSPADIRSAASAAAAMIKAETEANRNHINSSVSEASQCSASTCSWLQSDFVDEEAIFSMPSLLVGMAGGMLLSPPRISFTSQENQRGETLWSYF